MTTPFNEPSVYEVQQFLTGNGGQNLHDFMNSLHRAALKAAGRPTSELSTFHRANRKDGGVDAKVSAELEAEKNPSGYYRSKTAWQYKATGATPAGIKDELLGTSKTLAGKDRYVLKQISEGAAYRFVTTDDLSSDAKDKLEEAAIEVIHDKTDVTDPDVKIIAAKDIALFASHYAGRVHELRGQAGLVKTIERFDRTARTETPNFVTAASRNTASDRIKEHLDFSKTPAEVFLNVFGEAGIGKTRFVAETIRAIDGGTDLFVGCDGVHCEIIANSIVEQGGRAIYVVDECSADQRAKLREILFGDRERVRVITISHRPRQQFFSEHDVLLEDFGAEITEQVLEENAQQLGVGSLPLDVRRTISRLCKGFVRLAVACARSPDEFLQGGAPEQIVGHLLDRMSTSNPLGARAIRFLSLVPPIIHIGDGENVEVGWVAAKINATIPELRDALAEAKNSPGFIAHGPTTAYVTPEIVSRYLFNDAWSTYVGATVGELQTFVAEMPPDLLPGFLDRAAELGGNEARRHVGTFLDVFKDEESLMSAPSWMVSAAIESTPETTIRRLANLLEEMSDTAVDRFPSRRAIIHRLTLAIGYPKLFHNSERALLRLASRETERLGNNASAIWAESFAYNLSRVATPLKQRTDLLRQRIFSWDPVSQPDFAPTLAKALQVHLCGQDTAFLAEPVFAGQVRPPEWKSESEEEWRDSQEAAHSLFSDVLSDAVRRPIGITALTHAPNADDLFESDFGTRLLEGPLAPEQIDEGLRRDLSRFLTGRFPQGHKYQSDRTRPKAVEAWLRKAAPKDEVGRLRSLLMRDYWDDIFHTDSGTFDIDAEMAELSEWLRIQPNRIDSEIDWILDPDFGAVVRLGAASGKLDGGSDDLFVQVCDQVTSGRSTAFLRGYVVSRDRAGHSLSPEVMAALSNLATQSPSEAFEVIGDAGEAVLLGSVLDLAEHAEASNPDLGVQLIARTSRARVQTSTSNDVRERLARFLLAPGRPKKSSRMIVATIGELLGHQSIDEATDSAWQIPADLLSPLMTAIENASPGVCELYQFDAIWPSLIDAEPQRLAEVCLEELSHGGRRRESPALAALRSVAEKHGHTFLDTLSDPSEKQFRLCREVRENALLASVPLKELFAWIDVDVEARAMQLAAYVPYPVLPDVDEMRGKETVLLDEWPKVSNLTRSFLDTYGRLEAVPKRWLGTALNINSWWGNPVEEFRQLGELASKLRDDPTPGLAEWAAEQQASSEALARNCERDRLEGEAYERRRVD